MVNKAEELHERVMAEYANYKITDGGPWLRKVALVTPFYKEMTNRDGVCSFYQWLACLIRLLKPQLVAELGADKGGSAIFILSELPETGVLFSVDIREGWELVPTWDKRLVKVNSNDLEPSVYTSIPSKEVGVWFIDSTHSPGHVQAQMNLNKPSLKAGTVLVNHDIYLDGIVAILKSYPWDFWEDKRKVFGNGVGMHVV